MDSLAKIAADLQGAALATPVKLAGVVSKGALNIKRDWANNARASSGKHAPAYPSSISYDLDVSPMSVSAEVGPDKGRPQGALGNLLEFGSVNNPPHMDGQRALDKERKSFIKHVTDLATPW